MQGQEPPYTFRAWMDIPHRTREDVTPAVTPEEDLTPAVTHAYHIKTNVLAPRKKPYWPWAEAGPALSRESELRASAASSNSRSQSVRKL